MERAHFVLIPSFPGKQLAKKGFSCMGDLWDKNADKWLSQGTLNQYQRDRVVDEPTFSASCWMIPDECLSYIWMLMDLFGRIINIL
jgi:hypothetical protein